MKVLVLLKEKSFLHIYQPMKMGQIVPKRWHIKFRCRGITQKKAYKSLSLHTGR